MTDKKLSPTKRALLEKWKKGKQAKRPDVGIPKRPVDSPIPLSLPQQRQLFLELLDRGTAVNNLSIFIELKGKLNHVALEKSANQILARHDVLRTRFILGMGNPEPEILDSFSLSLPVIDLQKEAQPEEAARTLAEKEVLIPFDLGQAPLIRFQLYQTHPEKHLMLLAAHHTISDGWSLGVFLKELMQFYGANVNQQEAQVAALPIQYADYAYWQTNEKRKENLEASLSYWKKQLEGELPTLELPTDQARGNRQTFTGGTHRFVISETLTNSLEALSRQEDVTLYMTLLSAFYTLLYRYSGQQEILIGTPTANRTMAELEPLIGVFINTLVLRANIQDDPDFRTLLQQIRKVATEAYANQNLPFEKLVEALKPKRDLSRTPLFQVVFNLQNAPLPKLEIAGLEASFQEIDRGVSQFDLTLMITKRDGACYATVEYNSDLFAAASIERWFQSYQLLLSSALAQPDLPISKLPLVPQAELERLLHQHNQTTFDFPQLCMHELFEDQVAQSPHAEALHFDQSVLTYQELNLQANGLARHLQALGVGPGVRVCIFMKRSLEMLPALLSVMKAGGTYVPIHSSFPPERIKFILKDAEVQVLLTNLDSSPLVDEAIHILNMDDPQFLQHEDTSNLKVPVPLDQLAYLIYTSGSTGQPKGVMIQHAPLTNFLWSMRKEPGIRADDVLMAVTSISFDIAALELFLPLLIGAKVVIATEEMLMNPNLLGNALESYQVSLMQATPATWQLLLKARWKGKKDLNALCGGEALPRKLANKLLDRVDELWNMYGPTETTIWSSCCQVQKDNLPIHIGKPIGNTQMYILDSRLQPLPRGVIGELHIGGTGLAAGYVNRQELTEERFIPDSINGESGARLYKTGDRARFLNDDSIEVLGRMDFQLKLNGHRIELGEINTVLLQQSAVAEALVVVRTESQGEKRLVAYFTTHQAEAPEAEELRSFMRTKLPPYMLPSFFIHLETFPLSPNGKIDRKALPLPEDVRQLEDYVAPRNEAEKILAEIWQHALHIEQIGIHDNFFDLGGASMQSLQIVAKANMYGFQLSVEDIFEFQTIAELVEFLQEESL